MLTVCLTGRQMCPSRRLDEMVEGETDAWYACDAVSTNNKQHKACYLVRQNPVPMCTYLSICFAGELIRLPVPGKKRRGRNREKKHKSGT